MVDDCSLEIMNADGGAGGTIFYSGLFGGSPSPGGALGLYDIRHDRDVKDGYVFGSPRTGKAHFRGHPALPR
jgi:hypothetical protein